MDVLKENISPIKLQLITYVKNHSRSYQHQQMKKIWGAQHAPFAKSCQHSEEVISEQYVEVGLIT